MTVVIEDSIIYHQIDINKSYFLMSHMSLSGPYTGGEVGVVSHPPTGKQPGLVPPCLK